MVRPYNFSVWLERQTDIHLISNRNTYTHNALYCIYASATHTHYVHWLHRRYTLLYTRWINLISMKSLSGRPPSIAYDTKTSAYWMNDFCDRFIVCRWKIGNETKCAQWMEYGVERASIVLKCTNKYISMGSWRTTILYKRNAIYVHT